MASGLKVIALISGGKDSLFSILHCLAQGHEVVALANLFPSPDGQDAEDEDIDSYMYQTVGYSIVPLYAEILGVPLYREPIMGTVANSNRDYAPPPSTSLVSQPSDAGLQGDDETESLIPLLTRIIKALPEANAVSTGAILSTYQRTRVESVAIRLGLVPLSFLWQYPYLPPYQQSSLLEDMRTVGQDARIIKVASGGLDEGFLWQNVADEKVVRRLKKRMAAFGGAEGGAVLGEGGEFETLVLSGPRPLWKGRIEVGDVTTVVGKGGSAVARLGNARVVRTDELVSVAPKAKNDPKGAVRKLRIPSLLDNEFARLLPKLEDTTPIEERVPYRQGLSIAPENHDFSAMFRSMDSVFLCSGLIFPKANTQKEGTIHIPNIMSTAGSVTNQMIVVMKQLRVYLYKLRTSASSIISSTLLLRNMSDFTTINSIYGALFTEPIPPSRVTVALGDSFPPHIHVVLSVIINLGPKSRRTGLHVQSRSYWAPANIGPYSQAISIPIASSSNYENNPDMSTKPPKLVYIAGQIPLVPASMDLVTPNDVTYSDEGRGTPQKNQFIAQTVLSLQHLWRIGRAMEISWWTAGLAFISDCPNEEADKRVEIVTKAWRRAHNSFYSGDTDRMSDRDPDSLNEDDDNETVDPWDLKNRTGYSADTKEKDTRPLLPDYTMFTNCSNHHCDEPPCFILQVSKLPRDADVEWTSNGLANCSFKQRKETTRGGTVYQTTVQAPNTDFEVWHLPIKTMDLLDGLSTMWESMSDEIAPETGEKWKDNFTIYTTGDVSKKILEKWRPIMVPCRQIWDSESQMAALLIVRREAISTSTMNA